jgi:glycine dehydrogenase subunit 1
MYLSLLGRSGLEEAARQSMSKAHYAYSELIETNKFEPAFSAPFFMEFAVSYKGSVAELNEKLLDYGIIGGYDLSEDYPELSGTWLLAVTEKRTKAQIDDMVTKAVRT